MRKRPHADAAFLNEVGARCVGFMWSNLRSLHDFQMWGNFWNSMNFGFSRLVRLGGAVARFVLARHAGSTQPRPNLCYETPFREATQWPSQGGGRRVARRVAGRALRTPLHGAPFGVGALAFACGTAALGKACSGSGVPSPLSMRRESGVS